MDTFFTVFPDHKPLENMIIRYMPDEVLGDLTYYLSQYYFKINHNSGRDNLEADCLSRNAVLELNENQNEQFEFDKVRRYCERPNVEWRHSEFLSVIFQEFIKRCTQYSRMYELFENTFNDASTILHGGW